MLISYNKKLKRFERSKIILKLGCLLVVENQKIIQKISEKNTDICQTIKIENRNTNLEKMMTLRKLVEIQIFFKKSI